MFGDTTAFRHFGCGGAIHRRDQPHRTIFKCATYWEWSEDLLDLVKDPQLKELALDQDNQTAVPPPTAD